ncbi:MAG: tRNA lysidine(34) synthetase TilS [Candidatus Eremiobacteraeota bacterium]|nr:tRNA lysidine(34) synthetase TilS [Candidatus Eremiobacteraeota bacterium]
MRRSKRATSGGSSNAPPAAANTFEARLRASWHQLFAAGESDAREAGTVLVACSGGSDSAAALLLSRRMLPDRMLVACYVNHGLRPAAAVRRDIAAVKAQAAAAGARVHIEPITCDRRSGASPEEEARTRRYEALERVAHSFRASYVITGHHCDDAAETVLLALMRGSGLDGLTAMRPKRPLSSSVIHVRPFLDCSKEELGRVTRASRVPASRDETNDDMRFRRNAVRRALAQLKRTSPLSVRAIARSAALLTGERTLLDSLTARAWKRCRLDNAGPDSQPLSARRLSELARPLLRRVIRHTVKQITGSLRDFSMQHCDAIADAVARGRGGVYHAGNATVHLSAGALWVRSAESPNETTPLDIDVERLERSDADAQEFATPLGTLELFQHSIGDGTPRRTEADGVQFLDGAALGNSRLQLRTPRRGDTCVPSGRHRPVSLARFLSKAGVPRLLRSQALLLCADGRIAAVLGVRVMEPFAARDGEPKMELRWHPAPRGPILNQAMARPKTRLNRSEYVR